MRGVLLKSHWFPTSAVVPYMDRLYVGPTTLWCSRRLNPDNDQQERLAQVKLCPELLDGFGCRTLANQ